MWANWKEALFPEKQGQGGTSEDADMADKLKRYIFMCNVNNGFSSQHVNERSVR